MKISSQKNWGDSSSPELLALSLTAGFAASALIGSSLVMGDAGWPHIYLDQVMVGLYDLVLWSTIGYIVWLSRSCEDERNWIDYATCVVISLVMWIPVMWASAAGAEAVILGVIGLAVLYNTFRKAVLLHRQVCP